MSLEFSQAAKESLKSYVYLLIDPRNDEVFYVGKGNSNRCYEHINEALILNKNSEKCDLIRQIQNSNNNVIIKILRHGLNDDEAFLVESVCIDLLKGNLTNLVSGHDSGSLGIMATLEIEQLYNLKILEEKDLVHKVIFININNLYEKNKCNINDLYEATRSSWCVDPKRASKAQFIIATYKGISRAIFQLEKWVPAKENGRHEFLGKVAPKDIQDLYNNRSLARFIKVGAQNPIKYSYK